MTLDEAFGEYFEHHSLKGESSIKLKQMQTVVSETMVKWDKVLLATAISMAIATVYLMLRYRLSRGLTSLVFPVLSVTITIGIILVFNFAMSIPATAFIAVPVISLFTYFFLIQFYNRERELILEDKVKDNTVEHRAELAEKAYSLAFAPILVTSVVGIYLLINFFGFGPANMSMAYIAASLGALIALGLISVLIVPLCNYLFKLFSKVHIERKPRKNKNANKPLRKSAEPEEAIFIGIND